MKIIQVSAGRDRSVALSSDGTAYAWGSVKLLGATLPPGYPGELCISSPTEIGHNRYAQPLPQVLNPGMPFSTLADGYVDTLAVKRAGGVLSCRPVVSQQGGAEHVEVAGLPLLTKQIALTESGGFALDGNGVVWSWGMRAYGQLGRDTPVARPIRLASPAAIAGLPPIAMLAAGHGHVLALGRNGSVWSWGANGAGQLGTGHLSERTLPAMVGLPLNITAVAAGDTHSFALDNRGHVWGWGSNHFGQTGDTLQSKAAAAYFTTPQRIKTGFSVAKIDAGMFYTVASSTQGDVFAWGWNAMGQLAQEGLAFAAKPQRVKLLRDVTQLAAGVGHALALSDKGMFAWGDNRSSACGAFPSTTVQTQPLAVLVA